MQDNFSHNNLRGISFKGKNLSQADFSYADIRGANFTNSLLVGANFSNAKSGLKLSWLISLVVSLLLFASLVGLMLGYGSGFPPFMFKVLSEDGDFAKATLVGVGLIILGNFCLVILNRGIGAALGIFAVTIAVTTSIITFWGSDSNDIIAASLLQAILIAIIVAGVLMGSLTLAVSWLVGKAKLMIPVSLISTFYAIFGVWESIVGIGKQPQLISLLISLLLAISLFILSAYIGLKAIFGNKKYALIHQLAINICSRGGTNFRGANLTDANFTEANLKHTDLRKATLTRTCWFQAKQLHQACIEGQYLANKSVQKLVITKDGRDLNYDYLDLRGVNLQDADLSNASLIGTHLSEVNLQSANLSGAKLVKAQFYGANLSNACLTGAIIQDWAISTDTRLDGVRCDFIYMRLPTKDKLDPRRKPDNEKETFKEGDFADFIAPIIKTLDIYQQQRVDPRRIANTFKTLDLYHYEGIDPSAAAITLNELAQKYPDAGLEVVALEGRRNEKIRLQAVVTDEVKSSQLSAEYSERYSEISSLPYQDIQNILTGIAEKDDRIRSLEQMVLSAIQSNKFYVETYHQLGDSMSEKSSVNFTARDISGVVNLGSISGSVTNTINKLPDTKDPNQPSLKELLTQLQKAIESEEELTPEDKAEALEQVETLAEAGQNTEDSAMKKSAKTAIKILKGTTVGLSETTKLVVECTKLLPAISTLLGLV